MCHMLQIVHGIYYTIQIYFYRCSQENSMYIATKPSLGGKSPANIIIPISRLQCEQLGLVVSNQIIMRLLPF